jgi:chemotaxis protein methyltransferase CheR
MKKTEIVDLELKMLKETIFERYGYDFRHYSKASFKRRTEYFLSKVDCERVSELVPRIINDKSFFESFFYTLCITTTEMFRDPHTFKTIRDKVVPVLRTFPFIKIWSAGCSTGEEAYALAIIMKEEGLASRTQIYATDFNEKALAVAKEGIYPVENMKEHTTNYQQAGGKEPFSDYYHAKSGFAIMDSDLKKNIVFANYNLASDAVFGEMHLILCRNVLIYFNRMLQNRVLNLLSDSLVPSGFLCLGTKESIQFSEIVHEFKQVVKNENIFKLRSR